MKRKLVIFNQATSIGHLLSVRRCARHLHREGSGLMGEASRYITTGAQAGSWSNAEAMANPGMGGNEKAWIEVKLGLALKEN